jgi:hypothetical protein
MNVNRHLRRTAAAIVAGAAALLLASACSGSSSDSSAGTVARDGAGTEAQPPSAGQDRSGGARGGSDTGSVGRVDPAAVTAQTEYLARSAMLAVKVKSIAAAAASVRSISAAHEGVVLSESIGDGGETPVPDRGRITAMNYGQITISVPGNRLDQALAALSEVGTVIRRESTSENVREQYIDTESRVKTMRASVDRVRALMARATDIAQIVTLESELSRRQADLEALEAQLASLKDRVARAPIQVSLTTDSDVIVVDDNDGFLAGLQGGWRAFTASVVVLLTGLGAVLPFAVTAAVVALPVWWVVRRRRGHRAPVNAAG